MRAGSRSPTPTRPSAATTRLTATASPRTSRRSPRADAEVERPAPCRSPRGRPPATGSSQPAGRRRAGRPRSGGRPRWPRTPRQAGDRARRAGRQRRAVAPGDDVAGGEPRGGDVRSRVALVAVLHDALRAGEHRDRAGSASRAPRVRQRLAARPRLASMPAAPSSRSGHEARRRAARAASARAGRVPPASSIAAEDREGVRRLAGEDERHRRAAGEAEHAGEERTARPRRARPRPRAAPRPGARRPARRAAATTASWAIPMPSPTRRGERDPGGAGREALRHGAVIGERVGERAREQAAGEHAERARRARPRSAPRRRQPPDLARRRAEGAQHRGLAPPLGDRERERAGHHEQRDRAGDPAHRPRRWPRASRGRPRAGRPRRRRPHASRSSTSIARTSDAASRQPARLQRRPQATASAAGDAARDHADGVHLPGRAGERSATARREEQRRLAAVPARAAVREPVTRNVASPAGRGDAQRRRRRAGRGRASATTSRGPPGARPARSAYGVSAALGQPWPVHALDPSPPRGARRVPGAGGERDVADRAGDARHRGGPGDGAARSRGPGITSTARRRRPRRR